MQLLFAAISFARSGFQAKCHRFRAFAARIFSRGERIRFTAAEGTRHVNIFNFFCTRHGIICRFFIRAVRSLAEHCRLAFFATRQQNIGTRRREGNQLVGKRYQRHFGILHITGNIEGIRFTGTHSHGSVTDFHRVNFSAFRARITRRFASFHITNFTFTVSSDSLLIQLRFATLSTTGTSGTGVTIMVRLEGLRLRQAIGIGIQHEGIIGGHLMRQNRIFHRVFIIRAHSAIRHEDMGSQRIRLLINHIRIGRRVRCLVRGPVEAHTETIGFISGGGQLRTMDGHFFNCRTHLQRQTIGYIGRRRR